jgi:transposase-like protein
MRYSIPKRFTEEDKKEIVAEYMQGIARLRIAKKWGTNSESITAILQSAGCPIRCTYAIKVTDDIRNQMIEMYKSKHSLNQIAEKYGLTAGTVAKHLRRAGVAINPKGAKAQEYSPHQIASIARLWKEGLSQKKIGQLMDISQGKVSKLLQRNGVPSHTLHSRRERHGMWKGGIVERSGYRWVRIFPEDPMFSMAPLSCYVAEHRLVLARFLGRPLESHETVHHINGDGLDNRIENLQLRQGKHGKGASYRCCDCGSSNVKATALDEVK